MDNTNREYQRLVQHGIEQNWLQGKIIILVGPRQVGKTTLVSQILNKKELKAIISFNCDNPSEKALLENKDFSFLNNLIGDRSIIYIDEGQKVENIGQTLKLLVDQYKKTKQIIVTGSSSVNLLSNVQEALTGRKIVYTLFPLSMQEMFPDQDRLALSKNLNLFLIYGCYPEVITTANLSDKEELLHELTDSYLFKDIFEFQRIKNPTILRNLLKALALQIGSEVSDRELAALVGIDKNTVEKYIDLLEKNFIIFRLPPYFTNQRKQISKLKKVFFYDLGIRNTLINNFNPLDARNDIGGLWENFVITERLKYNHYHRTYVDQYFWRSYSGGEIDLVEARGGKLFGYEIKWNNRPRRKPAPKDWQQLTNTQYIQITKQNFFDLIFA